MIDRLVSVPLRSMALYASVAMFTVALLLFDTWSSPLASPLEWLLLLLLVIPVVLIGEWLSGGILRNALAGLASPEGQPFHTRWWRVFYYSVMCVLFATATVSIFEWARHV
jgi:hypothetical protein